MLSARDEHPETNDAGVSAAVFCEHYPTLIGLSQLILDGAGRQVECREGLAEARPFSEPGPDCVVVYAGNRGPRRLFTLVSAAKEASIPVLVILQDMRRFWVDSLVTMGVAGILADADVKQDLNAAVDKVVGGGTWYPVNACSTLIASDPGLSPRELETLAMYAEGALLADIGRQLYVGESTVRTYLARVREKYEAAGRPARTRLELRREAIREGLIDEVLHLDAAVDSPDRYGFTDALRA